MQVLVWQQHHCSTWGHLQGQPTLADHVSPMIMCACSSIFFFVRLKTKCAISDDCNDCMHMNICICSQCRRRWCVSMQVYLHVYMYLYARLSVWPVICELTCVYGFWGDVYVIIAVSIWFELTANHPCTSAQWLEWQWHESPSSQTVQRPPSSSKPVSAYLLWSCIILLWQLHCAAWPVKWH
jgi:hypothetical protein